MSVHPVAVLPRQDSHYRNMHVVEVAIRLRLAGRVLVHRPGGIVFLRVTGTSGPLTAWLVGVGARVAAGDADGVPLPSSAVEPR